MNAYHGSTYDPDAPWFEHSARLVPHSHSSSRLWFFKREHLGKSGIVGKTKGRATSETVKRNSAMIAPGRFLQFGKAYLNHQYEQRAPRSIMKPAVTALIFLERALRDLNNGDNDPANLSHTAFVRADAAIAHSRYAQQRKRDAGMELERLANILQASPAGLRRGSKATSALNLLSTSFSFKSKIEPPSRYGKLKRYQTTRRQTAAKVETLSSADVASIGICYREAIKHTGASNMPTFVASLVGIALTTASLRASDLQPIRRDALFEDEDIPGRLKLRVPRPKIGTEQILPVPRKLNEIALEFFHNARSASQETSEAFRFYIEQSPSGTAGIHELFIPERLKSFLEPAFIPWSVLPAIIGKVSTSAWRKRRNAILLEPKYFVERPNDSLLEAKPKAGDLRVRVADVVRVCEQSGVAIKIPNGTEPTLFVNRTQATRWIQINLASARHLLNPIFDSSLASVLKVYASTSELKSVLLEDFKCKRFPHWPYTTKDRSTRLDEALCVYFEPIINRTLEPGRGIPCWWRPSIFSIACLQSWISGNRRRVPILFSMFDVKLASGKFPSISIHKTRRYHHTEALRAGVSPPLANELAGRTSSWQGEHYDHRSPEEILVKSIDTFDPEERFEVIGPAADIPPAHIPPLVDREEFIRHVAGPKHVTDAGGCRRSWALNPCHMFGDCTRCGDHVWRKGDVKRLPFVTMLREKTLESISTGKRKLRANPRMESIRKHLTQLGETMARCDEILRVEADPTIAIGTIVTFSAARTAMSDVQFLSHLRNVERVRGNAALEVRNA